MKTLVFVKQGSYRRNPTIIDFDKHTVDALETFRSGIDDIYVAPEDLEVRFKKDGKDTIIKANKGDVIITFYQQDWIKNPVIVVKNSDWKENIIEHSKQIEADKAKNLIQATFSKCEDCYPKCEDCCCPGC